MSLISRIVAFAQAVGADIKALNGIDDFASVPSHGIASADLILIISSGANVALTANVMHWFLYRPPVAFSAANVGAEVTVVNGATKMRISVHDFAGSDPGALIAYTPSDMPAGTTGLKSAALSAAISFKRRLYAVGIIADAALSLRGSNGASHSLWVSANGLYQAGRIVSNYPGAGWTAPVAPQSGATFKIYGGPSLPVIRFTP
jgi:hypothetical protein